MKTVLDINSVNILSKELHSQNKKIVLVGGCFDLLHLGHITLLEEAKKQGDTLVVLLESDKRIQQLKGNARPLHTQSQRAHMLMALRSVDYVVLIPDTMTDQDYTDVTKRLQPAIIATTQGSVGLKYIEQQAKEVHAQIFLVKQITNLSTSKILEIVAKEL